MNGKYMKLYDYLDKNEYIKDDEEVTCSHLGEAVIQYFDSFDDEVDIYIWNTGEELKMNILNYHNIS